MSVAGKWEKVYDFYGRHMPYIHVGLIFILSFVGFLSLFRAFWLFVPLTIFVMVFNAIIVGKVARKEFYPHKLLHYNRLRLFLLKFSILLYCAVLSLLMGLPHVGFKIEDLAPPINQILSLVLVWSVFFIMFMLLFNFGPSLPPHKVARLSFILTMDAMKKLETQRMTWLRDAHKHLRCLKRGFQSCNDFLLKKPYQLKVKDIDQFYERIHGIALVGEKNDLKKIRRYVNDILASLGRNKSAFDLRSFLTTLQRLSGKKGSKAESSDELIQIFLIRASIWERTKVVVGSPYTRSVIAITMFIVTLVVEILKLLK